MERPVKLVSIGNYKLEPISLGEGTFARVELATHVVFKKKVAMKITVKPEVKDLYVLKHLDREAHILARLDHPNIVKLIEVCISTRLYCLVLEYVPNGNLYDFVRLRGHVQEPAAKHFFRQLVSAVQYMHNQGILHRDLKLENILLDKTRIVLVDFGLSNTWFPGRVLRTHCGSAEYAAPELFLREEPYGPAIDVWSMGIVLYAMLLGQLPFEIKSPTEEKDKALIKKIVRGLTSEHFVLMSKLSLDCRMVIIRCLETNGAKRITVDNLAFDTWIETAKNTEKTANVCDQRDPLSIAQELKDKVGSKLSAQDILMYLKKRRFGTTAGCFNLLSLAERDKWIQESFASEKTLSELGPEDEEKNLTVLSNTLDDNEESGHGTSLTNSRERSPSTSRRRSTSLDVTMASALKWRRSIKQQRPSSVDKLETTPRNPLADVTNTRTSESSIVSTNKERIEGKVLRSQVMKKVDNLIRPLTQERVTRSRFRKAAPETVSKTTTTNVR